MVDPAPHPDPDRDPDDLDAAASDHVDDPAAVPTDEEPLAARIAAFEAVGAMVGDVPEADDLARRAQINAALDTIDAPVSTGAITAPATSTNGTGTRRRQLVGLAAGIVLMAGAAIGLSALAGTISPGDDSETIVADAADDPAAQMELGDASTALDDAEGTPALGDFDSVEELVDAYRSSAERVANPVAAAAEAPEAATEADAAADAVAVDVAEVPASDNRCDAGDGVATGRVTGRTVVVMAPAPTGEVTVVFLDDCSVVPVPSSP